MANNKNNINDSGLRKILSYLVLASQNQNIIDDLNIATDKTSSSKHIKDLIDNMSAEDRKYVDDIVANLNKLSSKTTNVVPDASNVEANTLYLYNADLSTATSFEQYMVLSDKTILPLGNTNISLVDYMKTSDADNKYLKKIDSHSHSNKSTIDNLTQNVIDNINNLKVEVDGTSYTQDMDGKITLPNYPVPRTDDEIKALKSKLDFHCNKAISIFDFIDSKVTDGFRTYTMKFEETAIDTPCNYGICEIIADSPLWIKVIAYDVVSKDIYIAIKENGTWNKTWTKLSIDADNKYKIKDYNNDLKVNNTITKLEDLLKLVPRGETWYIPDFNIDQTVTDYGFPEGMQTWGSMTITNSTGNGHYLIELQTNTNYQFYKRWIGETKNGTAGSNQPYQVNWKMCCMTGVADVPKTFVPFTAPSTITVYNADRPDLFGLYYIVKNGICYVDVTMSLASISQMANFTMLCSGMPKPAMSYVRNEINSWNDKTAPTLCMAINGGESTFLLAARNMSASPMTPSNSDGHFGYFCSFSYPVAES